jgi:hypothetical protein
MSYSPISGVKHTGLVSLGKRISSDRASRGKGEIAERDGAITERALCTAAHLLPPWFLMMATMMATNATATTTDGTRAATTSPINHHPPFPLIIPQLAA